MPFRALTVISKAEAQNNMVITKRKIIFDVLGSPSDMFDNKYMGHKITTVKESKTYLNNVGVVLSSYSIILMQLVPKPIAVVQMPIKKALIIRHFTFLKD